jgi:hypothetical protein
LSLSITALILTQPFVEKTPDGVQDWELQGFGNGDYVELGRRGIFLSKWLLNQIWHRYLRPLAQAALYGAVIVVIWNICGKGVASERINLIGHTADICGTQRPFVNQPSDKKDTLSLAFDCNPIRSRNWRIKFTRRESRVDGIRADSAQSPVHICTQVPRRQRQFIFDKAFYVSGSNDSGGDVPRFVELRAASVVG